jgi:hypothetical protein
VHRLNQAALQVCWCWCVIWIPGACARLVRTVEISRAGEGTGSAITATAVQRTLHTQRASPTALFPPHAQSPSSPLPSHLTVRATVRCLTPHTSPLLRSPLPLCASSSCDRPDREPLLSTRMVEQSRLLLPRRAGSNLQGEECRTNRRTGHAMRYAMHLAARRQFSPDHCAANRL